MMVEFQTFERDIIHPFLAKFDDWYMVCNSHKLYDGYAGGRNKLPEISFRIEDAISSAVWDKVPEEADQSSIIEKLCSNFFDFELDMLKEDAKEQFGIEVTTDCNGYRLLLQTDLYSRLEEWEEMAENLENEEESEEPSDYEIECIKEDLVMIEEHVVSETKKLMAFLDWGKGLLDGYKKHYTEDFVVVINDDDEYDFVHQDEYYDFNEENNWRLVKSDGTIIDERTKGNQMLFANLLKNGEVNAAVL